MPPVGGLNPHNRLMAERRSFDNEQTNRLDDGAAELNLPNVEVPNQHLRKSCLTCFLGMRRAAVLSCALSLFFGSYYSIVNLVFISSPNSNLVEFLALTATAFRGLGLLSLGAGLFLLFGLLKNSIKAVSCYLLLMGFQVGLMGMTLIFVIAGYAQLNGHGDLVITEYKKRFFLFIIRFVIIFIYIWSILVVSAYRNKVMMSFEMLHGSANGIPTAQEINEYRDATLAADLSASIRNNINVQQTADRPPTYEQVMIENEPPPPYPGVKDLSPTQPNVPSYEDSEAGRR